MQNFKLLSGIFFLAFIFSCQTPPPEDTNAIIENQLRGMEQAFRTAPKSIANFYADDAVIISADSTLYQGRSVLEDYWANFKRPVDWKLDILFLSKNENDLYESDVYIQLPKKPLHWDFTALDLNEKKELVYQLGHSKLEYETEDDLYRVSHVDFILVWEKQANGEYLIIVDTYR